MINDHGRRKTPLSGLAVGIDVVVRPYFLVTVLFDIGFASVAVPATSNDRTSADDVTYGKLTDVGPNLHHFSNHLMPTESNCKLLNAVKKNPAGYFLNLIMTYPGTMG